MHFTRRARALPVRAGVLSARMQVPQENAAITRRNALVRSCVQTRFRELLWRHNEEKLLSRLRQSYSVEPHSSNVLSLVPVIELDTPHPIERMSKSQGEQAGALIKRYPRK